MRGMEQLQNIWEGWLQFGIGNATGQFLIILDLLLVAGAVFFILRFANTKRGIAYLGALIGSFALLVFSANVRLPAFHVLSQVLIVVLLIGLPIFFEEKWLGLFTKKELTVTPEEPAYLHPIVMGILALVTSLILVGLHIGPGIKTAELPQGVAVSAASVKEGMSANFGSQKRVSVIIRAPRSTWATLKDSDFTATVDVKGLDEGTHDVPLLLASKREDVQIVRSKPSRVTVTLEPVIRKTVGVVARFSGKAGNDLVPDDPIFNPDKTEITGPRSIVEDIGQAIVQVKLDGQTQAINQKYRLVALNSSGQAIEDVTFAPAEVETKIALVKAGKLKNVGIKVKTTGQPAAGYWVQDLVVTPAVIVVTGPVDALDNLTAVETDTVSISGLNKDTDVTATLAFPSGITAAETVAKVAVKIRIGETSTTKSIVPTISYEGVDPSLKVASINPTSINTIVSGTSSALGSVNGSDVLLKLNLSPYKSAGTYAVTIKNDFFSLKEGVSLVSFLPSAISVTLELK